MTADGLVFAPASPDSSVAPTVTGVRCTTDGRAQVIDADLVVAANGPRSNLPVWLARGGAEVPEKAEDTGIVYFSRFYRLADGADAPKQEGPVAGDLGYLKFAVFPGDDHTYSITLAVANRRRRDAVAVARAGQLRRGGGGHPGHRAWARRDAPHRSPTCT